MTAALSGVRPGDKLYEYRKRPGDYWEYEVLSIGRKWVTLSSNSRCTIDGLMLDCAPYGMRQLYRDKAKHTAELRLNAAWNDFLRDADKLRKAPEGITVADINAIRAQLGLQVLAVEQDGEAA